MALLVRGGTVVTAGGRRRADVLCDGGRVVELGDAVRTPADAEVIDAAGRLVLPGGVDAHTHMELPLGDLESADDFFTGTRAAIAGGTTTIIDFISPNRGDGLLATRDRWLAKAEKACCDYALHVAVTWWSAEVERELGLVVASGVRSIKTYLAYVDAVGIDDQTLLAVLRAAGEHGALVTVHAEHGHAVKYLQERLLAEGKRAPRYHPQSRPPYLEGEAVTRALALARATGQPLYIVHTSTRDGLDAVRRARSEGQQAYVETCPHYLVLDEEVYEREDPLPFVLSPPLRARQHQDALWSAIAAGEVDTVATDHCPFNRADKARAPDFTRIPNGGAGVEQRLVLMHTFGVATGRMRLEQLVELCCTRPARIFGLHPRKGDVVVGGDADLVVFDPERPGVISARTHHQRVDQSLYEGTATVGAVTHTVVAGEVRYAGGELVVRPGTGRFLAR